MDTSVLAVLGGAAKIAGSVAGSSSSGTISNNTECDMKTAEQCAVERAKKLVMNMLQRPDQLHKVDQYRRRTTRKKVSVEAMLKTAMQSQLDGVRTGLGQLHLAIDSLQEVKLMEEEIKHHLSGMDNLGDNMDTMREEYVRYSQYLAATENLKHIFTVPESIEKTKKLIQDNDLLHAHQCLMDLENSRDDLLFELHKLPHQNPNDTKMLKEYFSDVHKLSEDLGKQVWMVLQRTLNIVRKEPAQLVTSLRLIEREERADRLAASRYKSTGYLPEGRPKKWREKAFTVIQDSVSVRIEAHQCEERETNKLWLIRHLEMIRLTVLEDLRVVKSLCVPCFPPQYDIVNTFISLYHRAIATHMLETVEGGLEDNEFVSLLGWVLNIYLGPELMAHPSLAFNVEVLPPLLEESVLSGLVDKYMANVRSNYSAWLGKALELEEAEWRRPQPPDTDSSDRYKTELPYTLHQMVKQNIDVASTISNHVCHEVIKTSLQQLREFVGRYRTAILTYRDAYFADRSQIQYFTTYMIGLVNSCQAIVELSQLWRPPNSTNPPPHLLNYFTVLAKAYQGLQTELCTLMLEEPLVDVSAKFGVLLSPQWLTDEEPLRSIAETLKDYFTDYQHLHPKNYEQVLQMAIQKVCVKYISAMLQKKITCKSGEDRKAIADRVIQECSLLSEAFDAMAQARRYDNPCEAIRAMAEVLRCGDQEMLDLELPPLRKRYPDMSGEQLSALLSLRGDLSRAQVRTKVTEAAAAAQLAAPSAPRPTSIFSRVPAPATSFLN